MRRALRGVGFALLWLAAAAQAEPPAAQAEREQIQRERAAVQSRYQQAEVECRERFAVSGCMEEAQATRREALSAGWSRMYQDSQSVREPPPSVTVNTRLREGISQRCLARPASIATR